MGLMTERVRCRKCALGQGRLTVPPTGVDGKQYLTFVGEAPGANEDQYGKPFIGKAGNILVELLEMLDLKREQVLITNVCKCRPPANRDPYDDEREACIHQWLIHELTARGDDGLRLVIPLGKVAMTAFLGERSIYDAAGRVWSTEYLTGTLWDRLVPWGAPVLRVYPLLHPASIFRSGENRKRFWADAGKLKRFLVEKWWL